MDNTENARMLAIGYLEARNYQRAEEVLRSALTHNPQDVMLLTEMARTKFLMGDHRGAERFALQALALEPENGYPMRIYAATLGALGRRKEALSWAQRAIDAAPLDYLTHYEYAMLLVNGSDKAAAETALPVVTEALRLGPDDADCHNLLGLVLGRLGRTAESTAAYREALRLDPEHAWALHNIAVNRANRRRLSSALAGFREAASLDPGIGDHVRRNITETVFGWLRWMAFVAWLVLYLCERLDDKSPGSARIIAACGATVMLVLFVWLLRSLPRQTWRSVLRRQQKSIILALYFGWCAVVTGVLGAMAVGVPIGSGGLLIVLLITVVLTWVGTWIASRDDKSKVAH